MKLIFQFGQVQEAVKHSNNQPELRDAMQSLQTV